ncbi:hypothetical protein FT663_03363 [Candidozyma haemuli var. vulneris]|uniref:Cell wall mannoprotein PIR1-like C-terminal domain-containing protein n=1 Tax=Candidozyma haemuli TaxID=45357 RepID=A0A2V1B0F3_9ASCO|nr:hypothetical protein CXQ85_003885 [[Candida] haemuloni]KAF3985980.1 hypothetical protein FT662_04828 [[Candida] haemuloni var. vulneris]KAF3990075.1 hypothetical protein FT663_03363 [[Candida] haemuloni var. vulneris]PVH23595.1 hypothetical protein CXQ85_003885 [[Candida] haemuloni]
MQLQLSLLALASSVLAAYVPSEPWTDLKPEGLFPSGTTDYSAKFGIQIVTLSSTEAAAETVAAKREVVNQIGDGQIQHQSATTTASVINQIGDGQIQHQTAPPATPAPTETAKVINQIGDGQIQHQTASVVNQIGDGQIQHQTASVVNQIGDGQIQHQTASVINQIGDGQIQHQTTAAADVSQIDDGQIQATDAPAAPAAPEGEQNGIPKACIGNDNLAMTLEKSVLRDGAGRIGAIVSNRQFQFDGPPPQAGSIYAAGWSITEDGLLALGEGTEFFQCKSGDFYNLYDENIAEQCEPVHLSIIDLVQC